MTCLVDGVDINILPSCFGKDYMKGGWHSVCKLCGVSKRCRKEKLGIHFDIDDYRGVGI